MVKLGNQPDQKMVANDFQGTFNIISYTQHTYIMYTYDLYLRDSQQKFPVRGGLNVVVVVVMLASFRFTSSRCCRS